MTAAPAPVRRVVVGYDGSESSARAVRFALSFTRDSNTEVWLVHAAEAPRTVAEPRTDEERETEAHAIEETMQRTAREADPTLGRVHVRVQEGRPADVLVAVANEVSSDLVVVGTRGLRGASRLVLGSVSQSVVTRASRPVAVVP